MTEIDSGDISRSLNEEYSDLEKEIQAYRDAIILLSNNHHAVEVLLDCLTQTVEEQRDICFKLGKLG